METASKFGSLKLAGQLMIANAVFHIIAPLVSGFSGESLTFLVVGIIYGFVAWAFLRETRWLAYPMFLMALVGIIVAYSKTGVSTIPDFILWPIVLIDLGVMVTLFANIWRRA